MQRTGHAAILLHRRGHLGQDMAEPPANPGQSTPPRNRRAIFKIGGECGIRTRGGGFADLRLSRSVGRARSVFYTTRVEAGRRRATPRDSQMVVGMVVRKKI